MFASRVKNLKGSGIRKIFNLAATMEDSIDLSIGQPHFDVPDPLVIAAQNAIRDGHNLYTPTGGLPELNLDVCYSFTPATSGPVSVGGCDSPYSYYLSVHSGCPGTEANQIGCALYGCDNAWPQVDFEGELAVIIGRRAKYVTESEALSYVAGYTVANDVSERALQFRTRQFTTGKMIDTFCPLGPVLVTRDEVADPQQLEITTTLNGVGRQH